MTAISRTAVDPHAVICELVAAVEPDLPSETVRKAIGQAVRSKSAAVRLVQVLEADPELLTSGRAEGPASVERFIRALTELGAAHVVRPPCSRCGRLRPLGSIGGSGRRVCSSCSGSDNRKGAGSLGLRDLRQRRHPALRRRPHRTRGLPLLLQDPVHRGPRR